jgi:rubredoxin
MLHEGEESSSRKLVHIEGESFRWWGCSECAWVFNSAGPRVGNSLDEITRNFQMQLSEEFASHSCEGHSRAKIGKPSS